MSFTTKKTVFSDGIFVLIFQTVLKEQNFRPKSVSKLCETFKNYSTKIFSHKFRTNFVKKTNPSQNCVKYWNGFRRPIVVFLLLLNLQSLKNISPFWYFHQNSLKGEIFGFQLLLNLQTLILPPFIFFPLFTWTQKNTNPKHNNIISPFHWNQNQSSWNWNLIS